ncbi:NAD(P)/FAD-dependent oxidoreductase [Spelaeicoccus albus]|uniref:Thioredoxin reductase n=1 Tax=Spelaeicoccus albus TaxID=1280376 RepID=A0A7Z0A983_9MICO|nr:NAD(P)/FAD-dependent oxidoreductase [Spelaeicoccus albus]NYI66662.1 thioredoxin reductase [Spelaeicoccus albus]
MNEKTDYDVAIIGGGAAGLSAAVSLARSLRSVIVVDGGEPRNAIAAGAHNVLGNEGIAPRDLLAAGRREAQAYGAEFRDGEASAARRTDGGFAIDLRGGDTISARRILLATGLIDELPNVPGVRDFWGKSVLHCPYCHGWEVRGQRIGVLGTGPAGIHQALLFRQLSDDVTLFRHTMPQIDADDAAKLSAIGVRVVDGPVERLSGHGESVQSVAMTDGREFPVDAVVVAPRFVARSELYVQLGGTVSDNPMGEYVEAGQMGRTEVPGVWAAGNVSSLGAVVTLASGAGMSAAGVINMDLIEEDAEAAVLSRAS